jgi:hypothetical protein
MPVPPAKRQEDFNIALRVMAAEAGDEPLWAVYWRVSDTPTMAALLPTTLPELEEEGYVRSEPMMGGVDNWYLTEEGWIRGLELNGSLKDPAFRQRVYDLVTYLKGTVSRGDADDALLDAREIQAETGIPDGWVLNAVKSDLLSRLVPDKKMNAWHDARNHLIRVPPTFGMQLR